MRWRGEEFSYRLPFAVWIAIGPQQVGLSVIPVGSRHSRRVSSFPSGLVIPAGVSSFPPGSRHSRRGLVIPTESRHSHRVSSFPPSLVIPTESRHSHRASSFPPSLVIPTEPRHSHRVSSFPRRRESPVARLDAPLGELPPPSRHAPNVNGIFRGCGSGSSSRSH